MIRDTLEVMLRAALLMLALLGGCGRHAFDPFDHGDAGSDDDDGQSATGICGAKPSAPDPIVLKGYAFRYRDFQGTRDRLDNTIVRVFDRATNTELDMQSVETNGDYSVSIPTGGQAADIELAFERGDSFTTRQVPDRPLDGDVTAADVPLWEFGAGPLWSESSVDSIYAAGGATKNPAFGTINIAVRDCAGNIVEGAMVEIDPAPEVIRYQKPDGFFGGTATQREFATVVAMNVPPGPVTVTASLPGRTFAPQVVDVKAGAFVTMVTARALD